jgi:aarF domain-containing kinase
MKPITLKSTKALQKISTKVPQFSYLACLKNDGLYVKLGQGVAALDHLLPPPFYKYMHKLQDKAQTVSY